MLQADLARALRTPLYLPNHHSHRHDAARDASTPWPPPDALPPPLTSQSPPSRQRSSSAPTLFPTSPEVLRKALSTLCLSSSHRESSKRRPCGNLRVTFADESAATQDRTSHLGGAGVAVGHLPPPLSFHPSSSASSLSSSSSSSSSSRSSRSPELHRHQLREQAGSFERIVEGEVWSCSADATERSGVWWPSASPHDSALRAHPSSSPRVPLQKRVARRRSSDSDASSCSWSSPLAPELRASSPAPPPAPPPSPSPAPALPAPSLPGSLPPHECGALRRGSESDTSCLSFWPSSPHGPAVPASSLTGSAQSRESGSLPRRGSESDSSCFSPSSTHGPVVPASPLTGSPLSRESGTSSLARRGSESESDVDDCLCCPPHDLALPVSSVNGWSLGETDLPLRASEGDTYSEDEWRKQQEPFNEEDASCVPMEEKEKKLVGLDLRIRKPTRLENPENADRGWKDQEQLRRLGPECNYATYPAARVYSPRSAVRDVSVVPRDPPSSSSASSSSFPSPSEPGNGPAPSSAIPPSCEVHGNAHPAYATFPPMSASTYGWTKTLPRVTSEIRANGLAPSLSGGSSLLSTASSCALDGSSPSGSLSYPSTASPEVSVYTSGSSGESWTFVTQRESRAEQLLSSGSVTSAHVRPASAPKAGSEHSGHSGHSDGGQAPTGRSAAPAGLELGSGGQGPLPMLPSFSDFTLQRYLSEANHAFHAYPPAPPPPHPPPPPLLPSPLPFPPSSHPPPPPAHNGCGPFCRPVPSPLPPLPPLPLFALPPDLKGQAIMYAPLGRFLFEMLTGPSEDHEQRDGGELGLSAFKAMIVRFTSATNGWDSWRALTELVKLQSRSLGARAAPFDFRPQSQQPQQSRSAKASSTVYQNSAGSLSSQQEDGRGWLGASRGRCGSSEDGDPPRSARPRPGEQSGQGSGGGGGGGGHCQQRLGPGREEHVVQNPAASLDAAHGEFGDVHGALTTSPALVDFAFRADPSPPFSQAERSRYAGDLEHGMAGQVAPPSAHDSPAPRCAEGSAGSQNQSLQQASQQGQACQLQASQPTQQPSINGQQNQKTQQPSINGQQNQKTQQPGSDGRQSQPTQQSAGGDTGGQTQPGRLAGEPGYASFPTQTAGSTASSRTGPGSQNQGSRPQDQGSKPQASGVAPQGQDSRSQGSWSQEPGSGLKGAGDFPYVPLKPGSSEEMAADFLLFCMAVQSALTPPVTTTTSSGSTPSCSAMPAFGDCPAFPDFNPSWFRFLPGFPR